VLKDFPLLASKSGAFFLGIVFEGEKNPICTAWKAQSAKNARAAVHTSVRFLWKWRRMAVSGQLCLFVLSETKMT